jgi:hypothetical protein
MDEPINTPDGMKLIDTSKIDPVKLKEMLDKLKDVDFTVGKSEVSQDDQFIEGVDSDDAGVVKHNDDKTGSGVRMTFKSKKR